MSLLGSSLLSRFSGILNCRLFFLIMCLKATYDGRWEHGVLRSLTWGRDGVESNERDILIEGAIMGLGRNLVLEKLSVAIVVEMVSERAFLFDKINDYPNCHHRTYFQ